MKCKKCEEELKKKCDKCYKSPKLFAESKFGGNLVFLPKIGWVRTTESYKQGELW